LSKILGLNGHFTAYPIERQFSDYEPVVSELETIDGVVFAIAYVEGQALASGLSTESSGVSVRGIASDSIAKLKLLHDGATLGGWDAWDEGEGVAIGTRLAQKLGVTIGDPITIVNPNGTTTPFGRTPQIRSYPVNVIFDLGMVDFDSFYLFMPMTPAQTYFRLFTDELKPGVAPPGVMATDEEIEAAYQRIPQATAVDIFLDDADDIAPMRERIQSQLGRPLILTDWQQRNETFFSALQVERVVMFVILSMIILVAAFNIISSLVMLVKDKGADIAILRTMGATRGSIMRIFSMTGTAIGVAGTLIGLVLGLVIAINAEPIRAFLSEVVGFRIFPPEVFFLSTLPSKVDATEVTTVVSLALFLSVIATIYPAWRAAQYDPVEALRYE
jgi:lipoprotein-releasing system permease protein